jgi:hypothetical protein
VNRIIARGTNLFQRQGKARLLAAFRDIKQTRNFRIVSRAKLLDLLNVPSFYGKRGQ